MRCGRRVRAAIIVATTLLICVVCVARRVVRAGGVDDDFTHYILFSGRDLWRNGVFGYRGLLWAPGGLDTNGFMLKAQLSAGAYRYNSGSLGNVTIYGGELKGQVLPGWGFRRGHFELKLFAGLDFESHWLWPNDPSSDLRGITFGLALAMELWNEPTSDTMLAADASFSSVGQNSSARIAFGWRVLDQFYVGPEMQIYGGNGYGQMRYGMHVTSLKTEATEWSAAVGWAIDTDKRDSPYLRLGFLQRL